VWTLPPHPPATLAERFGIEPEDDWVPRYNIAPTQNVEVIRQHADEPKRFGSQMRWADSILD
jgi:putative SOS response-associated peptidase YedK